MRVYEFSKQHGLPSKELIELLNKNGFTVASHMSQLTPQALDFLEKKFAKKDEQKPPASLSINNSKPTSSAKESMETAPRNQQQTKTAPTLKPEPPVQAVSPKEVVMPTPGVTPKKEIVSFASPETKAAPASNETIILESITVGDFAHKAHKPASEVIITLLKWGILSNKNQLIPVDVVARLAEHYQIKTEKPAAVKEEVRPQVAASVGGNVKERLPIVVVVGHVDHGKTTLLDFIRKTRVASREKGGITQHLGAYEAQTPQGNVIFLDTPGHEAFSKMRSRGIKAADIAILVVAADDSVMPQTVEALKRIKEIGIPIIVAVNKIDKVDAARVDIVKRDLAKYDLMPEEWGGQVIYVPISAKTGAGVDHLLEMIVLQSQLMELTADVSGPASGYVLESRLEKGRGPVATLLLSRGTLRLGDYFSCGKTSGKINSIVDSYGKPRQSVGPSIPCQIAGFEVLPEAGDYFEVIAKEDMRKVRSGVEQKAALAPRKLIIEGAKNLIVKTDTNSSKEALLESIGKVTAKVEKGFNVIFAGVGPVNESDVTLAADTGSDIVTLHVKSEPNAQLMAQRLNVSIASFDVIYKLLESLESIAHAAREIKMIRKKVGEAVVRKVFDIKNIGVIAGAYVKDGIIPRDAIMVAYRGKQKIGEGKITSLQRDKKTVKEVHSGFECAFMLENFNNWQPDDRVECFILVPAEPR